MSDTATCPRCAEPHGIVTCPYVKAVGYDHMGVTIIRVEFLTPADYPQVPHRRAEPAPDDDYPKLK